MQMHFLEVWLSDLQYLLKAKRHSQYSIVAIYIFDFLLIIVINSPLKENLNVQKKFFELRNIRRLGMLFVQYGNKKLIFRVDVKIIKMYWVYVMFITSEDLWCTLLLSVSKCQVKSFDKQDFGLSSVISKFHIIVRHISNLFIHMMKIHIIQRLVDVNTHVKNTGNLQWVKIG